MTNKMTKLKQPCRKHYWVGKSFKNCPTCGYSGTFTAYKDMTPKEQEKYDNQIKKNLVLD